MKQLTFALFLSLWIGNVLTHSVFSQNDEKIDDFHCIKQIEKCDTSILRLKVELNLQKTYHLIQTGRDLIDHFVVDYSFKQKDNELRSINGFAGIIGDTLFIEDMPLFAKTFTVAAPVKVVKVRNSEWPDINFDFPLYVEEFYSENSIFVDLDLSPCHNLDIFYFSNSGVVNSFYLFGGIRECSIINNSFLESIEFSGNFSFEKLNIHDNQLEKLIINDVVTIKELNCKNNKLKGLELTKLTQLTILNCENNKIANLDVSGCTSLELLGCWNNQLTDENLPCLYGLNIKPYPIDSPHGIYFDLRGNKGFTESAIRKLADNLPNISYEEILYDKLGYSVELLSSDGLAKMKGVAADGESQLKIRFKYAGEKPDIEKIGFVLENDNSWTDAEIGFLEKDNQKGQILEFPVTPSLFTFKDGISYFDLIYTAPSNFHEGQIFGDASKIQVKLTTKITFPDSGNDQRENSIEIIRPPLMMVHGYTGDYTTYNKMASHFQNTKYEWWQCYSIDYSGSNTVSFAQNQGVIPANIDRLLQTYKIMRYEASKVDVVAHSMGGLLARQYLQNGYRNDINKLITLNTPHSGSQGANLLMQIYQNYDINFLNVIAHGLFLSGSEKWEKYDDKKREIYLQKANLILNGGSVADLCVDSKAIKNLRTNESTGAKVPTHAIYTTSEFAPLIIKEAPSPLNLIIFAEYFTSSKVNSTITSVNTFLANLYGGKSDLVVAKSSQIGGLDRNGSNKVSFIPNEWHLCKDNPSVIAEVDRLLSLSTSSNEFSMQGFAPPVLTYNPPAFLSTSLRKSTDASNIKIISIDKPNCTSNDELKIRITGSSDIKSISLMVQGEAENIYMEFRDGNDNEFSYTVPEEAIGYKKILAIGYTDSQTAVTDTASFTVYTSTSLLSIHTNENELWVPLHGKQQVQVQGLYSDGTSKNIAYLDNVRFEIKGSNASLESPNIIVGKSEGVDTLLVSCQGFEISLPIQVINIGLEPMTIELPRIKVQEKLTCYPNPAKEQVTIAYELTEFCSFAKLNIYDMKGQPVKTIELKNKQAGYHEEVISIGNISKGMYIVVLLTEKGNSYQKLLKE